MLVDHRERESLIPQALAAAGLDVRLTDLPVGDYVLGPGLAVERKGPNDLGASIRDGRIFDQAVRLQSAFPQAVLLIQGEPRGFAEDAWRGAVCRLVEGTGSRCCTASTPRTARRGSSGSPSAHGGRRPRPAPRVRVARRGTRPHRPS